MDCKRVPMQVDVMSNGSNNCLRVTREPSKELASHPVLLNKKHVKKEEESPTTELQLMTRERNDLKERLMILTEGTLDNSPDKNQKPNAFYEKVKLDHKQIMMELNNFEKENPETKDNFKELRKETVFYRDLHSRLLMERTQLKKKVDELRQEERKLQNDWTVLKYHLEDLKLIHNDQEEEISYLKIQQQQELKRLEESFQFLQKQREMVMQEKHLVQKLQHHFQVSQMRSKTHQTHLEQATAQDESHQQKDLQEELGAESHPQQY
ncbi:disks large homolog 5-like [Alexandromys fortis]|uniref:disks large homolog 5-like n=1 Tax=Alexandromys fortis TaxID=100897 RepID=UPI00215316E7|nr:disks large homolog 5-like [Microtus fortis]